MTEAKINIVLLDKGSTTIYDADFDVYQLFEEGKVYSVPEAFANKLIADGRFGKTTKPEDISVIVPKKIKDDQEITSTPGTAELADADPVEPLTAKPEGKKAKKKKGE